MFGSHEVRILARRKARTSRPWLEGLEHRVVLSTFRVNTTLDTVAVNLKNGKDASGHISLRSAIMAANAKPNSDTIIVPGGTFTLTIPGAGEDNDATGDLDIKGNLTIQGKGATKTIIDGNDMDRVIQVLSGKVSISKVTIQHGLANGQGGGILNSGGKVTLTSVTIQNNRPSEPTASTASAVCGAAAVRRGRRRQRIGWRWGWDLQCGRLAQDLEEPDHVQRRVWRSRRGRRGGGLGFRGRQHRRHKRRLGDWWRGRRGGGGGAALGGGIFNAIGASLTVSGTTISSNGTLGGVGGAGGAGGEAIGGTGGNDNGGVGFGGAANGGAGGIGGGAA